MITTIKEFKQLHTRLPQKYVGNIDFKNIKISDIELIDLENNNTKIPFNVKIKNEIINSIIFDIQVININDIDLYQSHLFIHQDLQNLGLGYKIYFKFIEEFGHIYSSKGRRFNQNIIKILQKFKNIYLYLENKRGDIIVINQNNPDKDILIKIFKSI